MFLEHAKINYHIIHGHIRSTKLIELKSLMDPNALAEQAVSLNLKLMKWRQAPELNL